MYTQLRTITVAAGVGAVLLAASGSAVADTLAQDVTEARQETQIWTTYALNPNLRAVDLSVSVNGSKATLTGTVEEGVEKELAKQIALGVKGIKDVDNQITIDPAYVAPARASKDRSYGEMVDDATITASVKSKLLWSQYADGIKTDVDTNRGKVTLNGTADSKAAKDLAGRLAANTNGVASVNNLLIVDAKVNAVDAAGAAVKDTAETAGRVVSDSWITTKVKSTLLYSARVHGSDIHVSTKGGVVTLNGAVGNAAEKRLAIELAQNVRGVKSVQSKGLTL